METTGGLIRFSGANCMSISTTRDQLAIDLNENVIIPGKR